MLTWYDVLGILPGAAPGDVQAAYQDRVRLLSPQLLSGAASMVLTAADAARAAADEAWQVPGDPGTRRRYDEQAGLRRVGGGLDGAAPVPSGPGGEPSAGRLSTDVIMAGLADLMTPHPGPPRRVIVPDVGGLFVTTCLRAAGDRGLHLEMVQLTQHPMPVEGLVVHQSPPPGAKVRRTGTLTVQVWHPPRRAS